MFSPYSAELLKRVRQSGLEKTPRREFCDHWGCCEADIKIGEPLGGLQSRSQTGSPSTLSGTKN